MLQQLRIDSEFESKIPPLREEEFKQLEENILADGVVINPLIVWDTCLEANKKQRTACQGGIEKLTDKGIQYLQKTRRNR